MKRTAIVIDDDPFVHKDVAMRLKSISQLLIVYYANSVDEAAAYFANHPEGVDVVICDIVMPGKDGYEANRLFAGFFKLFIFLTQRNEHGEEIFGAASLVHYLRKPINAADVSLLLAQLDKTGRPANALNGDSGFLFLKDRHSKNDIYVRVDDILMVNFSGEYGEVTLRNREEKNLIYGTTKAIAQQLKEAGVFVRINGHCIIAPAAIKTVDKNLVVYFHFGGSQPVTRTYKQAFRAFMQRYWIGK